MENRELCGTGPVDLDWALKDAGSIDTQGRWFAQADGTLNLSNDAPEDSDSDALLLDYAFGAPEHVHVALNLEGIRFLSAFREISVQVFGDGSTNLLKFFVQDACGNLYEYCCGAVDWNGWKTVTVPAISEIQRFEWERVAEPDVGWRQILRQEDSVEFPSPPLSFRQIKLVWNVDREAYIRKMREGIPEEEILGNAPTVAHGQIYIRGLCCVPEPDSLDGVSATLKTDRIGNLFEPGQVAQITICVTNDGEQQPSFRLSLCLEDFDGKTESVDVGSMALSPGQSRSTTVDLPPLAPGWYEVALFVKNGNTERRSRTSLGVLSGKLIPQERSNHFFGLHTGHDLCRIELARQLGVTSLPRLLRMKIFNPQEGTILTELIESHLAPGQRYGFELNVAFHDGAAWCAEHSPREGCYLPYPEAYGRFVEEVVRRYGNMISDIAIWNEPNLECFWRTFPDPAHYVKLLKAASDGARRADPHVRILAPNLSGPSSPTCDTLDYLRGVFECGGYDMLDVVAVHPYLNRHEEDSLPATLDAIVDLMKEYGKPKPIVINEAGLELSLAWMKPPQRYGAGYLARFMLHALAHPAVERVLWYQLVEGSEERSTDYGLVDRTSLAPHPAAVTYRMLATELGNAEADKNACRHDRAIVYHFLRPEGRVIAAWTRKGDMSAKLKTHGATVEAIDLMGRRRPVQHGAITLCRDPILLKGNIDDLIID